MPEGFSEIRLHYFYNRMYWRFSHAALTVDGDVDFAPEYDADGNQCRVKTSTGIWTVSYDAENRPTDFTSQAADGTITSVHF